MSIDLSQFHQIFYEESFEGLEDMESCLLDLDTESVDPETINTIFRAAHSIKGSSGTFGFTEITEFTHVLETLLDQIREGSRQLTQDHVDLLLQSVDCLRQMLSSLQAGEAVENQLAKELIGEFNAILKGEVAAAADAQSAVTESTESDADPLDGIAADDQSRDSVDGIDTTDYEIVFKPDHNMLRTGNEPTRMFRELAELGEMEVSCRVENVPAFEQLTPEECYTWWKIKLTTDKEQSCIEEVFEWVADDAEIEIKVIAGLFSDGLDRKNTPEIGANAETEEAASPQVGSNEAIASKDTSVPTKAASPAKSTSATKSQESTSIRVGTDKIDNLVNLVGELVITQSMLGQLGTDFDLTKLAKLQEGLAQLEHNTRELQESVMRIRMLPISFTFSRFPRMVRDLSRQLGKKVDIKLLGEQTELDKTVMEKIGDPMVHLVRNSLDHGLEPPEERAAAGKPETGTVTLNAYHQGGNIVIEIIDDGRGLNRDKIKSKAIQNGLISESDHLTNEQIDDLIFQPGFSTADAVTDVSGRGVGMDVVRRNIQALKGSVEVHSEPGVGSTFTIRLPLTLAILDGQLISVGEQTYIIPLVSIVESLQVDTALVNHVAGGCDVFRLRDEYIPIIKLWEVFGIVPASKDISDSLLVVLEAGSSKVALVVDDLLGQQQVVIKSMETNYKKIEGISGATILGDGTVSMILDITDLVHMAGIHHQQGKLSHLKAIDGHQAA
ncbi:MAG: chemotaxis protein CheA [Pseudomonadales bacterium]|nr:chemotaxis protein CheA [Pseudomonadales bacterium]